MESQPEVIQFKLPLLFHLSQWLIPVALAVLLVTALLWWRRTGRGAFGLLMLACMLALAAWGMRFLRPPVPDVSDPQEIEAYSRFVERLAVIMVLVHIAGVALAGAGGVALLRRARPQPADPQG